MMTEDDVKRIFAKSSQLMAWVRLKDSERLDRGMMLESQIIKALDVLKYPTGSWEEAVGEAIRILEDTK